MQFRFNFAVQGLAADNARRWQQNVARCVGSSRVGLGSAVLLEMLEVLLFGVDGAFAFGAGGAVDNLRKKNKNYNNEHLTQIDKLLLTLSVSVTCEMILSF